MLNALCQKYTEKFEPIYPTDTYNLLIVLFSLLGEKSVCLYRMRSQVGGLPGNAKVRPASHYQRLIRFFNYAGKFQVAMLSVIFRLQFQLLKGRTRLLAIDGTSWQLGKGCYHFLTLGMVWQGVFIPIGWADLKKNDIPTKFGTDLGSLFVKHISQ